MKIIAITQARYGSSRLPGKVLKKIGDKTMLELHLERAASSKKLDKLVVATTHEPESSMIEDIVKAAGHDIYKGSMDDVLDRFYQAALTEKPDYVVRITSDCPLIDGALIDQVIEHAINNNAAYCRTSDQYPDGVDVEFFSFAELERACKEADLPSDREHVTPYIRRQTANTGTSIELSCPFDFAGVRFTVDEPSDLEAIQTLTAKLGEKATWLEYTNFILNNLALFTNQSIIRNEGYLKSVSNDNTKASNQLH